MPGGEVYAASRATMNFWRGGFWAIVLAWGLWELPLDAAAEWLLALGASESASVLTPTEMLAWLREYEAPQGALGRTAPAVPRADARQSDLAE